MLTLLSELKFITSRDEEINVKDTDFGAFKFNEKATTSTENKAFYYAKKDYAEKRGLVWTPQNKPNVKFKLKSSLKHFEEEIKGKKIVYCGWSTEKLFQLMLSNGLLIYVEINIFTGDIQKINFDKYFVGKIVSENICDVIITRQHVLISYNENQITFVHLQKPSLKNTLQKISVADPKIFNIIIGGQTKKINRKLVINASNDLVLIWTKSSQNEFFPWRPSIKDQERANLHIYKLNRLKFEPLCYFWTENDPIDFVFSTFNENEVHSVEQKISRKGEVTVESCTYHISNSKLKLQRTSVTSIPLQTEVSCIAFSPDHEKLLMCCVDGSIVLFDEGRGITYLVKASFIPTQVAWHPDSALVIIANERSQFQLFDISLSCVKNQLLSEEMTPSNILDLSNFFVHQPMLLKLCWSKKPDINNHYEKFAQVDGFLLLMFETGIFGSLRFVGGAGLKNDMHTSGLTADVIIHMYISLDQIEKAINVLLSLNWDTYGAMCLLSLHKIANYIFKLPATAELEGLMQKALGTFHIPSKPLCFETENEFGDNVDDITRRFFHYLIRYKSFEKAFSLAIDINDADLFMILHKCAKAHGQIDMANESFKKAEEIYAKEEIDSHHSTCSITSCSICSNSYDSESEDDESKSESESIQQDDDCNVQQPSSDQESSEVKDENPRRLRKSFSAEILNHPPLPRFSRYEMKKIQRIDSIPPLPFVEGENSLGMMGSVNIIQNKNSSLTNLTSELTLQNLSKFNKSAPSDFSKTNQITFNPLSNRHHSGQDLYQKDMDQNCSIDQTIGIPTPFDNVDHATNSFYSQFKSAQSYKSNTEIKNDYEYHHPVPTTIHTYPLISGTIPASIGTHAKLNFSTLPIASSTKKDFIPIPTSSILSNSNNSNATTSNLSGTRKEGGEKNKVKFSDTITVAVVPEISRKEKIINYNERMKRKTIFPPGFDPVTIKRELAESLPLCHPNEEYLKDFLPAPEKTKDPNGKREEKKKPSIKVVNFGIL